MLEYMTHRKFYDYMPRHNSDDSKAEVNRYRVNTDFIGIFDDGVICLVPIIDCYGK